MWGDPVLRTTTRPVADFGAALQAELAAMGEAMDRAVGAGWRRRRSAARSGCSSAASATERRCRRSSTRA